MSMGVQRGAANDFNKIVWKSPRGSKIARFDNGESASRGLEKSIGIKCGLGTIIGAVIPASINSAAGMKFNVSIDDHTYVPLYDETGTLVEIPIAVSTAVALNAADFMPWDYVQVVLTDGSGTPVAQAAEVDLVMIVARV